MKTKIVILFNTYFISVKMWGLMMAFFVVIDFISNNNFHWYRLFVYSSYWFVLCKKMKRYCFLKKQGYETQKVFFHPIAEIHCDKFEYEVDILLCLLPFLCCCTKCYLYYEPVDIHSFAAYVVIGFFVMCYVWFREICKTEISEMKRANNLDIGYGAALCYYYSYLKFKAPSLQQRIEEFKGFHQVDVLKKLFILFPKSGKVQKYIDNVENHIERCAELPELRKDHAGVRNRTFNITIYHIKSCVEDKGVRCAIEYAQPLKAIMYFKNRHSISEIEVNRQREIFFDTLKLLLNDENKSYKHFELVKFDDEIQDVHEVILEMNHVKKLKYV